MPQDGSFIQHCFAAQTGEQQQTLTLSCMPQASSTASRY